MQYLSKGKAVFILFVSSLILFAFTLLVTTNTVTNVSAVEASGVGVYWDSDCTDRVSSIDWGALTPGLLRSIVVHIRNEVEESIYLLMSTTNWVPSKASDYIALRWDYAGQQMNPGETLQTKLTLSVSRHIETISSFSFSILITGSNRMLGDIDGDDKVTWMDFGALGLAYGSRPGDDNWNPNADFDDDNEITWKDLSIVGKELR